MKIGELLNLNPQHLDELRSFFAGWEFVDVEIVVQEKTTEQFQCQTLNFSHWMSKLRFDGVFRGKTHTHCIFVDDSYTDNTFYCFSYAQVDGCEERIIFKIFITEDAKAKGAEKIEES